MIAHKAAENALLLQLVGYCWKLPQLADNV